MIRRRSFPTTPMLVFAIGLLLTPRVAAAQSAGPGPSAREGGPRACVVSASQAERELQGVVADAQGARVPDASVTASCGAIERRVQSGPDGAFVLRLPPGAYDVRVERQGFDVFEERVDVEVEQGATLNVVLTVSQFSDAITVRAPGGPLARRTTTATKTDTPLIETPQSVTIITANQIREQASPNLQETLRYTPGVRNELYGIDNRGDWVSLRGSEESTTLLDGLRLPLTGWYGVVRTEPYAFERIEVLRGPSSIIAGANDPGGVVNLVSKRPQAEPARQFGLRIGNYNRRELHADVTGPLNADQSWLYRFVALGMDGGTQIDHADERRALVAPSITWRPSGQHTVTVFVEYQYDRSRNTNAFLGLTGTLHAAPNGPIPTDLFIGEPDWDRYGGTRRRVGYAATSVVSGTWQLRHNLRHDSVDGVLKSMYAAWWGGFLDEHGNTDPNGRYLGRRWYVYDDRSQVTTGELLVEGHTQTRGIRQTWLFGVDGMLHEATQASGSGVGTPLNVYAPVYGGFREPSLGPATPTENDIRRVGVLVQDQIKLVDRVSVRIGVRRDTVRNAVGGGDVQEDWTTTGNLGVVYEVRPGLAPYASYAESFNPVAGTDAAGRAFTPKRGAQVETGLKWEARSRPVQATAAFYSLKERNRLASDPINVGHSIQIGDARIRGVELETRGELASWSVLGSYTYTRARASAAAWGGNLDPTQQIEGIPAHMASLWAAHELGSLHLPGFTVGGGARRIGRIGDGTGQIFVPAVTLFDLMGSFESGRWRLALNINNLTDKVYIATCLARGDCWFGQRRMVSLTAGVRY